MNSKLNERMKDILDKFREVGVIPVVSLPKDGIILKLGETLSKAGVAVIELTFRNEFTPNALKELSQSGVDITYGAGTVRTKEQLDIAHKYGAKFAVSPGLNEDLVRYAQELEIPFFPGVDSTYALERAIGLGLTTLKMFPASVIGGLSWLKAMRGPYYDISFIPTGGINLQNLGDFIALPNVLAVGGSFLTPKEALKNEDFNTIEEIAEKAMKIVRNARGNEK